MGVNLYLILLTLFICVSQFSFGQTDNKTTFPIYNENYYFVKEMYLVDTVMFFDKIKYNDLDTIIERLYQDNFKRNILITDNRKDFNIGVILDTKKRLSDLNMKMILYDGCSVLEFIPNHIGMLGGSVEKRASNIASIKIISKIDLFNGISIDLMDVYEKEKYSYLNFKNNSYEIPKFRFERNMISEQDISKNYNLVFEEIYNFFSKPKQKVGFKNEKPLSRRERRKYIRHFRNTQKSLRKK